MAKKAPTTKGAAMSTATVPATAASAAANVPVIVVPPGGTLRVIVDVGPMGIPYTVAYAGHTVIKSLVDRSELVPLQAGDFLLAWAFAHDMKGWSHSIGYSVDSGAVQVLEAKSEAHKDPDTSLGFALVQA
jgi:hypothetical protein